jgi:hypothetical protein
MTLEERLATIREQSKTRMPPEARAVLLRSIDDLRASGILHGVAKVGSRAPDFTLPNAAGQPVGLEELRARGALLLPRSLVTLLQRRAGCSAGGPAGNHRCRRLAGRGLAPGGTDSA